MFVKKALKGIPLAIVLCVIGAPNVHSKDLLSAGTTPTTPDEPKKSETITLGELLKIAVENNPAIQASESAAHAKKALIPAARTLPDPTVTLQSMGDVIPGKLQRGDPSSARVIGVEQEIPFPGKLGLKGKIASIEAEVEQLNHTQTRRQIVAELKQAYYELFLVTKSMEIVRANMKLLQDLAEVAETRYRVGQGIQQDALKAQVEISKNIDRLLRLDQRRVTAEAQINRLLNRPPDAPLAKPADFQKAELKYSLEELSRLAKLNSTALQVREREVERGQRTVELAQRGYYPDFSFGFNYYDREENPKMYGWMLKASVPLYFWRKQQRESESARSSLESARKMRESTTVSLDSEIKQLYMVATTSDRLVKLYATVLVPQTKFSLQSAIANYQVGKTDFLTLIDSFLALQEVELKMYESLSDFEKALAQTELLVGTDLTS